MLWYFAHVTIPDAFKKKVSEVLTLSRADEKSLPPGINKRAQIRANAGENAIPGARNFR